MQVCLWRVLLRLLCAGCSSLLEKPFFEARGKWQISLCSINMGVFCHVYWPCLGLPSFLQSGTEKTNKNNLRGAFNNQPEESCCLGEPSKPKRRLS